ncbi:MAG: hypothetical protein ABI867_38445 [Kofleriaceae bacterium]
MDEVAALLEQLVHRPRGHLRRTRRAMGASEHAAAPGARRHGRLGDRAVRDQPAAAGVCSHCPGLWGSANTGPWFHDNSAKTLAQHYSDYFQIVGLPALTAQEQSDIIEYLELLE